MSVPGCELHLNPSPGMVESLNVIALISGGKDSFFSLFHCIQNGHKVVALGNLYPATVPLKESAADDEDEHDLNSFMYQTVGHTVIPLYEKALGIPLYRQQIFGSAVQTGTSYCHSNVISLDSAASESEASSQTQNEDETESLVPLLRRIMAEHPSANAISTGAILSTYQRTRVESVALRLGLTPLSYLWQYTILPPGIQTSLLQDMQDLGLDARIVKVASGGLDETFLWENVASQPVVRKVERSTKRFSTYGDGAVLGEGGEFETLVIDGPASLFLGRIEVQEGNRRIVREGGGSAWLRIFDAKVVMKAPDEAVVKECRIPDLLERRFSDVQGALDNDVQGVGKLHSGGQLAGSVSKLQRGPSHGVSQDSILHWTISSRGTTAGQSISDEARQIVDEVRQRLDQEYLQPIHIISTVIALRSMADFAALNKVYGALFTLPNPPARVTISCGDAMPKNINLILHLKLQDLPNSTPPRKALHVQSRSYWAPANIGPYSQAVSIPQNPPDGQDSKIWTVSVAGQIPLIPHTMVLPETQKETESASARNLTLANFKLQTVLALQHLWRIGNEMEIIWWTSVVAYLPRDSAKTVAERAQIAGKAWAEIHKKDVVDNDSEDGDSRDLWEEQHFAGMENMGGGKVEKRLPDWDVVEMRDLSEVSGPPFFAVEVEELPRGAEVEWHAHLGLTKGPIQLFENQSSDGWAVYQCQFGVTVQTLVMIDYSEQLFDFSQRLGRALEVLGVDSSVMGLGFASYLDVSIEGIWDSENWKGAIPCRTLWDASGKRLAGVLLLGSL